MLTDKEPKTIGQLLQEIGDVKAQLNKPAKLFRPRKKVMSWKRR